MISAIRPKREDTISVLSAPYLKIYPMGARDFIQQHKCLPCNHEVVSSIPGIPLRIYTMDGDKSALSLSLSP